MKKNLLKLGMLVLLLMATASTWAWTIDFKALGAKYQDKTGVTISEAVVANVGTVSIVNGNLIVGEGEEAATASEDFYGNFALQTGTTWLIRPAGLYSQNGGGRAFGILNCKKDQNITIDVTTEPTITSANAELKSNEGTVYVYTVLEDGDVLFNLARYNSIASISVNWEIDFAALGAKYVDKTGVTISEAVVANVGTVSIVDGTLITPIELGDETQQTTDNEVFDPSFALQTGTNWLIRPAGLYSSNGGGRAFGILNCKKDQCITIDVTAEPGITSGNAELKSKDGNVYVYTVTEDGDVLFNLARYNTIARVAVGDIAGVEYTVKFVNEGGETIKEDVTHKGEVGTVVELTASDKASFMSEDGTIKYIFKEADNTEENTIKEDGSTIVTVVFRHAEVYTAVLNCMIDGLSGTEGRLASYQGTFFEGDNYSIYPPRGIGKDGKYYFTEATSWNGATYTFPGSLNPRVVQGVTYYIGQLNYVLDESVAYYSDFERLALPVEDEGEGIGLGQLVGTVNNWWNYMADLPAYGPGNYFDRFSQGRSIRLDKDSYVYTEPIAEDGTYMVTIYGRNDKSENCVAPYALGLRDADGNITLLDVAVPDWGSATTGTNTIGNAAVEAQEATEESEAVEAQDAAGIGIPAGYSLVVKNTGNGDFISLDDIKLTKVAEYAETPVVAPVYTVAGTEDLTGYDWDPSQNVMTLNAETGLYEWTAENITVTANQQPEFKVVKDGTTWYPEGNWVITADYVGGEGIYTILITFNAETTEIGVIPTKTGDIEIPVYDIHIYPESGADIAAALAAAEEGIENIGDIYVELAQQGQYTISGTLTAPHNFYLWGNDATVDASALEAPMTALTTIEEPTEWTTIDHFEIKGVTVKGLKQALFFSSCKNYYINAFDIDWANVEVAADVTVIDFTKGSVANLNVTNSTFYAPTETTKSFYSSQSGQKLTEYPEYNSESGMQQTFTFTNNTMYNLAKAKNFFSHRQSNQSWLAYNLQNNLFVNCGKSGQTIKGMNGGQSGKNPTWIIIGNAFNFDGADTSAAESTGDDDEPIQASVAGVVEFTDAANGDFNGEFTLAEGATAPESLGAPMWTITFVTPEPEAKLYVIGDGNGWDRASMIELAFDEAAGTYKYEIDATGDFYFAFADYQPTAEEAEADPNWEVFNNNYRYSIAEGDQAASLDTEYQLVKVNGTIKLSAGKYNVYVTKDMKMTIKDATTDGINALTTTADNAVIYNLKGQRVMNAQKGLYIQNGKKVVLK